ncbi:hypothetical protein [Corynebacterium lubricantis]|uniref:hypothetical protein n=1 Tax=Corynebacterium lubricantis TaxID=541095 RepID=UPI0003719D81|nr:hypothetical protein [Corynebacterium lubricantis]
MGASRDLTSGYETGNSATLLEKGARRSGARREALEHNVATTAPAPRRLRPGVRPHEPRKRGRLGSNQVVSVRGRRVEAPTTEVKRRFTSVSIIGLPLLAIGVALAMIFSGLSTQQTFTIQQLQATETSLSNEVETLNRDLENLQSSAEIARRASDAGMVVPVSPGIVEVGNDGAVTESRPADPETQSIIDVNGAPVRPGRASSDPNQTDEVSRSLEARPNNEPAPAPQAPQAPAVAPYSPNVPAQF